MRVGTYSKAERNVGNKNKIWRREKNRLKSVIRQEQRKNEAEK